MPNERGLISSSLGGFIGNSAIQADFHKLTTDTVAEAPILVADAIALQRAIQNAYRTNPDVQNAQAQLHGLKAEWKATRAADNLAITAATTNAERHAAIAQKRADYTESQANIAAAKTVLRDAIANDPGVKAAAAKVEKDSSTIRGDLNAIGADAGNGGNGGLISPAGVGGGNVAGQVETWALGSSGGPWISSSTGGSSQSPTVVVMDFSSLPPEIQSGIGVKVSAGVGVVVAAAAHPYVDFFAYSMSNPGGVFVSG